MMRNFALAVFAALLATAVGGTYAAKVPENDALGIVAAKVGLIQAATAAEQYVGGKASRAEYERYKDRWVFDIEVVKDGAAYDVKIDSANGAVIEAVADRIDRDDDHDPAD